MKRKFLDENGRVFGLISLIDVLVILLAVLFAVAFYVKSNMKEYTSSRTDGEVTYQILTEYVRDSAMESLRPGDEIFTKGDFSVGTVTDVQIAPARSSIALVDGSIVAITVPDRYDVTITITAPCSYTAGCYYAGGYLPLRTNSYSEFYTKYNYFSAYIAGVTE